MSHRQSSIDIQHRAGFYVAGLAVRTNNADEMNGSGKIGKVWHHFLQQNLAARILDKVGTNLIALYTDYDGGHTGHYTYLLGVPVLSFDQLPVGVIIKEVPAGRYALISSNKGPVAR